jgi:amidase
VREATPPLFERSVEVWGAWLMNELRPMLPLYAGVMGPDALKFLGFATERFAELDVAAMTQLLTERHRIAREWAHFQEDHPLLLSPVWTETAFVHGRDVSSAEAASDTLDLIRCVLPANLLGLPAAVVPAAVVDGLPVGVQLTGARFREDLCLDAAAVIEAALGRLTPIEPI